MILSYPLLLTCAVFLKVIRFVSVSALNQGHRLELIPLEAGHLSGQPSGRFIGFDNDLNAYFHFRTLPGLCTGTPPLPPRTVSIRNSLRAGQSVRAETGYNVQVLPEGSRSPIRSRIPSNWL